MNDHLPMPLLRLDIQGLRAHVVHALSGAFHAQADDIAAAVDKALAEFDLSKMISDEIRATLPGIIRDAVSNYAVRDLLTKSIGEAICVPRRRRAKR